MLINPYVFAGGPPPPPAVTWNPLDKSPEITLDFADLRAVNTVPGAYHGVRATKGIAASADGYFELYIEMPVGGFTTVGLETLAHTLSGYVGQDAVGWGYYAATGAKVNAGSLAAYGSAWGQGDIIGVALKAGSVWFAKNGVWQGGGDPAANTGAAFTGITGTIFPAAGIFDIATAAATARFKASAFTYTPPTGFSAWE